MDLTEKQWSFIQPLLPKHRQREDGKGRPRQDDRQILQGILWILKTGARWQDLPPQYPPYQTCHRRFQEWTRAGTIEKILKALAEDLLKRGNLDLAEAYIDGSFSSAKKGVLWLVRQSAAKGPRSWQSRTAMVFLSRPGLKVLAHMKSSLSKLLFEADLPEKSQN